MAAFYKRKNNQKNKKKFYLKNQNADDKDLIFDFYTPTLS